MKHIIEILLFLIILGIAGIIEHLKQSKQTMTSKNDITGDLIKSKSPSQKYYENYDKIFKKEKPNENLSPPTSPSDNDECRKSNQNN